MLGQICLLLIFFIYNEVGQFLSWGPHYNIRGVTPSYRSPTVAQLKRSKAPLTKYICYHITKSKSVQESSPILSRCLLKRLCGRDKLTQVSAIMLDDICSTFFLLNERFDFDQKSRSTFNVIQQCWNHLAGILTR